MHASGESPWYLSAKHYVLGACFLLIVPFRSMLLTRASGPHASSKGSWGWVGIRARCLTARLPNPPVRPVRETFASYGSRERDVYRKLPFRQLHGTFTVVSLRVRWVPLYRFPTLSLRAFAMYPVFPHSDYYALFDCLEGFGVSLGSRLPTVHPPSHPFQALPCSKHRTQSRML